MAGDWALFRDFLQIPYNSYWGPLKNGVEKRLVDTWVFSSGTDELPARRTHTLGVLGFAMDVGEGPSLSRLGRNPHTWLAIRIICGFLKGKLQSDLWQADSQWRPRGPHASHALTCTHSLSQSDDKGCCGRLGASRTRHSSAWRAQRKDDMYWYMYCPVQTAQGWRHQPQLWRQNPSQGGAPDRQHH